MTSQAKADLVSLIFGSSPVVLAKMWKAHHETSIEEARIHPGELTFQAYLIGHYLLKTYQCDTVNSVYLKMDVESVRQYGEVSVTKIGELLHDKVAWPTSWGADYPTVCSQDSSKKMIASISFVHCPINKVIGSDGMNKEYYSFKLSRAALKMEVGLDLKNDQVVWVNGPFPAGGRAPCRIFREEGLKDNIPKGMMVLARGNVYGGEREVVATPNSLDDKSEHTSKKIALARHQVLVERLKSFASLSSQFNHQEDKFGLFFRAVVVICQFQMENDSPLYRTIDDI